jgi:signal transduction histidine kinase
VPEAERETVFEDGFTRRPGGRGLGLFIVRTLVVCAGGQVHCAAAPSGGAAFHVWLPLLDPGAPAIAAREAIHG